MVRSLALLCIALASGCASLPSLEGRSTTYAYADTAHTRLGEALAPALASNPGKTGIHSLPDGREAFAARVVLAGAAQRSIDAQYYIWHPDQTGLLMLEALLNAARRGARVRMLLDDQNTSGLDSLIAALGSEPNIEVRLYNPFAIRKGRALNLGDFERLNRRMHNKAFIVDGQAAIVGGRNIGNEYFDAVTDVPFKDLDVIAIGPAVREISAQFDLFWNSASAYPAPALVGPPPPEAAAQLAARFDANRVQPESRAYLDAVSTTPIVTALLERRLAIEWTEARLVLDDPAKTLDPSRKDVLLLTDLFEGNERPRSTLDLVSPYFVPGDKGTAFLEKLANAGVRIRVLTNSLAATDVAVVHSGYAKRRCQLARAGVHLYELTPSPGTTQERERHDSGLAGSGSTSASSLHAKTYSTDGDRIFVGSFNFDPRSALLNTEMGLVIRSAALAGRLTTFFDHSVPGMAYEVRAKADGGCLEWIERTADGEVRHETEPGIGWAQRAWVGFLSLLPIDWML